MLRPHGRAVPGSLCPFVVVSIQPIDFLGESQQASLYVPRVAKLNHKLLIGITRQEKQSLIFIQVNGWEPEMDVADSEYYV